MALKANDDYGRTQSSSVSPRGGGYGSSASTPHSSNGGYTTTNGTTPNASMNVLPTGSSYSYDHHTLSSDPDEKSAFIPVTRASSPTSTPNSHFINANTSGWNHCTVQG
ncbi:transcription factor collier-like [Diaphorina citri]|uniref:Transcription factor collier-like n=1 Tax=Diaphorina citri TaxID=121845 RepID=A0A1S4ENZ7_DIACI|nr:transcription factor collier-like [Diaphorina citri]